ncbi:MAG: CRISPR-associated endonuclease Cas1 [Polaromonas sp.]|uniref:CRISPR-associated endonuclease Cas1 n=1 Tax=Polaromonas sp. TaxID=1869339 RepID=UPI0027371FE5|nr:CRISPR-associated endonuclease Cas1 [Polaromonas sp.]MDP2817715.1 CRISPR-associated endonuclease Cas1 [Polaromonas sp.]
MRRILHAKERGQALFVVDYQGNLATLLTARNKGNLHKGPMLWCDLANRRRPTALFRFKRSPGMKLALRSFLESCVRLVAASVSASTIEAAVDMAYRLADQGAVGLAALVRGLRRPEMSYSLRRNQGMAEELDRLVELLEWALCFPAVWALSEGNNLVDLGQVLTTGGTVWLEMSGAHFERLEHQLVSWMVDAALVDALLSAGGNPTQDATARHSTLPLPLLLHAFPTACPLTLLAGEMAVKQIGVFAFSATQPLPLPARVWLAANADCWIAGDIGQLPGDAKAGWLDESERNRLRDLQPGQVWVRSGSSGKAVTALVRVPEANGALAHGFRRQASKLLRLAPVKQFSTTFPRSDSQTPVNADLYRKLCTKEALYAGWFRVKAHNRDSHGHDLVTIRQFGVNLDAELQQLALEMAEGRYRCRPLRTARIPKPDGDVRILKIACVRDRVAQAACLHLIEPVFDARFSPSSFAYRPGRGAHHAVALARSAIGSGKHWAVTADIRKCFDSIDHEILLRLIGDVIGDRDLIQLIRHWLVADVIDFTDIIPSELGVPQGEAISPLLANIYLDQLDKEFEKAGTTFVRYADDYVVLCHCEAEAQAALRMMGEFLQGVLRLALKPAKTHYCPVAGGIEFLGFKIGLEDVCIPPQKMEATIKAVSEIIEKVVSSALTVGERHKAVMSVNPRIRGFRNYFLIDNAPTVLSQLQELDAAVDAFASARFATLSDIAAAWALRERFSPDGGDGERQSQTAAEVAVLTGGYPLGSTSQSAEYFGAAHDDSRRPNLNVAVPPAVPLPNASTKKAEQPTDPDVLVIDGRLHVMTSGCFVTINGDELVVRRRKVEIFRTAITELSMVYLEGKGLGLSADLTMRLCEKDVPVVFTPLVGLPAAIAQPVQSTRSNLRQLQVLRRNDPDILKVGLGMLAAKTANQASVLKYFARYRKRTDDATYSRLTKSADGIRVISAMLDSLDPSVAAVRASAMGHEGRAAVKYWSSFADLIPEGLSFPGRHTRHASDPVNSAINYVYGMLYGEVWRAVIRAGLDPYFGIIHGTARDQGSLVFDLIEEFRAPFGDRLVLGMLGRGFALDLDKEGRLRSASRHKLVLAFHKQWHRKVRLRGDMRAPSSILDLQVMSLKNAYLGKEEYRAFRFRW